MRPGDIDCSPHSFPTTNKELDLKVSLLHVQLDMWPFK